MAVCAKPILTKFKTKMHFETTYCMGGRKYFENYQNTYLPMLVKKSQK